MIIRYNCFETNSSSTHALCIGKGRLEEPYVLINKFKNNEEHHNYDTLEKDDKYTDILNNKKYEKKWENKSWEFKREILLRRFEDLGRTFDIFDSSESKLNFIWTCLVSEFSYKSEHKKYDPEEMLYKFLEYIYSLNLNVRFLDLIARSKKSKEKEIDYGTQKDLVKLNNSSFLPKNIRNKYLFGKETYGYYPMEELDKILNNSKLFWNLVLGESKIYTGSDEEDSFEDLNFNHYKFKLVGGSDHKCCETENVFDFKEEKVIGSYENGNYKTTLYADGTRTRELFPKETFYEQGLFKEDFFEKQEIDLMNPKFPESIDLKITNYCDNNCKFCYAESNDEGSHAEVEVVKRIISEMRPYTEIALGGGNTIAYPHLKEILEFAKSKNVICNITLKDVDILKNEKLIREFIKDDLIKAIGVSPTNPEFLRKAIECLHGVDYIIHLVLGIHNKKFFKDIGAFSVYIDKILILGYKEIGKGKNYFNENSKTIKENIEEMKEFIENEVIPDFSADFKTLAFDNLAIKQLELDVKNKYKDLYQGDDGKFSFYIDAVKEVFAKSSLEEKQNWYFNLDDAFEDIKRGE